jgi:hypothetical protein
VEPEPGALDPGTQVIAASLMAGLGIGALGLVVVPPCVTAWMSAFTGGVCGALLLGRTPSLPAHAVDPVHARRRDLRRADGCALGVGQLKTNADFGSQSESAACCSRNMSSAASAGCGRSMPTIASPTSARA